MDDLTTIDQQQTDIQPVQQTPMQMVATAVEKGMDVATLKGLMDLQERWEAGEAKKAYAEAMTEFKKIPLNIFKNKDVAFGNTSYSHATLDKVSGLIGYALADHGLKHAWSVNQSDGNVAVTCTISHMQGHSESVTLSAPPDDSGKKNSIQQIASTVTYLERYTLLAATGTAVKEQDNDGATVSGMSEDLLTEFADKIEGETSKAEAKKHYIEAARICQGFGDITSANTLKAVLIAHGEQIDKITKQESAE